MTLTEETETTREGIQRWEGREHRKEGRVRTQTEAKMEIQRNRKTEIKSEREQRQSRESTETNQRDQALTDE